jgi:hypothetical protein
LLISDRLHETVDPAGGGTEKVTVMVALAPPETKVGAPSRPCPRAGKFIPQAIMTMSVVPKISLRTKGWRAFWWLQRWRFECSNMRDLLLCGKIKL